jgi:hypothetical protein
MTKEEEKELLYKHRDHYLWNKVRSNWTEEDIENLKQGLGPKKQKKIGKQAVLVIGNNQKQKFESVCSASRALNISGGIIYAVINEKRDQLEDYKFFKIN